MVPVALTRTPGPSLPDRLLEAQGASLNGSLFTCNGLDGGRRGQTDDRVLGAVAAGVVQHHRCPAIDLVAHHDTRRIGSALKGLHLGGTEAEQERGGRDTGECSLQLHENSPSVESTDR